MAIISDETILKAEQMREKAFPDEEFPERIHAVAQFLSVHPDIVTGIVLDLAFGVGAG